SAHALRAHRIACEVARRGHDQADIALPYVAMHQLDKGIMDDILSGVRISRKAPNQPLKLALLRLEDIEQFCRGRHAVFSSRISLISDSDRPETRFGLSQLYWCLLEQRRDTF